ncbi:hypothetical protein ABW19_dt0204098 [Dactylella cylindrospora]|nr:hypothetical protein ABW19_dt0204098 [Dactylella cylindrospora]
MVFSKSIILITLLAFSAEVSAGLCGWNRCPTLKRAVTFGSPARDVIKRAVDGAGLERRQGDYTYSLTSLPNWAALPYSSCGGTTICPVSWTCKCQTAGYSRCMPSPQAGGCSSYAGATGYTDCNFYWSTTLSVHAAAYGQCGGYTSTYLDQGWDTRTICPEGFHCSCGNFWYSQCVSTNVPSTCPGASGYWGCGTQVYTSPQSKGDICGGHCFTVSGVNSQCPGGMSCWTQTASSPGFAAICDSTSPSPGQFQPQAKKCCYPVPFDWTGSGCPLCPGQKMARGYPELPAPGYMMTKPSRVPANSPAEATPATWYSDKYDEPTAGQQVTL